MAKDQTKSEPKTKELEEKWKRALADYANLEKRVQKEQSEFTKFSNSLLLGKLLRVLDSLYLCVKNIRDKGLMIVLRQFEDILKGEGLEEIEAEGKTFDPHLMEVVEIIEGPKDQVMAVVQKGYRLNEKVLRPVKVKVGIGKLSPQKKEESKKVEKEVQRGDYV